METLNKVAVEKLKLQRVETHSIVLGSVLLAILVLSVVVYFRSRRTTTGDTILLVGPSDGGKTAIFSSLVYNNSPPSHTSLQQNAAYFRSPSPFQSRPLRVIDIPGHPRIRGQFQEYLSSKANSNSGLGKVKGVVFVCDAAALSRNAGNVAEHLHLIMHAISNLPPSQKPPPLLIFANKADLMSATSRDKTKTPNTSLAVTRTTTILERELEKRRLNSLKTGNAVLDSLGSDGADGDIDDGGIGGLDVTGSDGFKFERWEGGEVEIKGGWVDIQRSGSGVGTGFGVETDTEDEAVVSEKPARGPEQSQSKEAQKGPDGLVELVDWVAGLRPFELQALYLLPDSLEACQLDEDLSYKIAGRVEANRRFYVY